MAINYLTVPVLKATLGITTTTYDADVTASINDASRAIDEICNRRFYLDADSSQVRYYTPVDSWQLDVEDIVTVTSLVTRDDGIDIDSTDGNAKTWTVNSDFILEPLNAAQDSQYQRPWETITVLPTGQFLFNTSRPRSVKLTGKFGWPNVPSQVIDACTLLAERLYKMKREAPLGLLTFSDTAVRIARADSNIMILLGPLVRHRVAVG